LGLTVLRKGCLALLNTDPTKSVRQKGCEAYFKGNTNIYFVKAKLKKNIVKVNLLYKKCTSIKSLLKFEFSFVVQIYVSDSEKNEEYWAKRVKNNVAARRSREAKRVKENQVSIFIF